MEIARLVVLILLAAGTLIDILILAGVTLIGGLAYALNRPAELKSIVILILLAACFAAPPLAFSFWRRNAQGYAFAAVCAPMLLAGLAAALGY
jgi:hypothetical protein